MTNYEFTPEQDEALAKLWDECGTYNEFREGIRSIFFKPKHGKETKLRIYINRKLNISDNKRAAHAVHAALTAFGVHPGVKVIVLDKGPTVMEDMRVVIHDAGHTELEPGTLTASTNWPEDSEP